MNEDVRPADTDALIEVGEHECVTCPRCACTFAKVHPACPRCSEEARGADALTREQEAREYWRGQERLAVKQAAIEEQRAERAEAQAEEIRTRIEEAECLLGEAGAGGSAAGLVPAIHNLISIKGRAEAKVEALASLLKEWCEYTDLRGRIRASEDDSEYQTGRDLLMRTDEALASLPPQEQD